MVKVREGRRYVAKFQPMPKKVMLCFWWDWGKNVHYKLLQLGKTIDSDLYCRQLTA